MFMENKSHLFVSSWYSSFLIQFLNLFINFIFLLFFYFFFLELLFFHLWKLIYKEFSPKQIFQFVSTQKLCISTLGVTHLKKGKKIYFFPRRFFLSRTFKTHKVSVCSAFSLCGSCVKHFMKTILLIFISFHFHKYKNIL